MKRVAMLLLVCIGVSQAKTVNTGWELRELKGKVKRCEESDKSSKWIFQFDSIGNEIGYESYSFNADKKKFVLDCKIIRNFTYDAKHNLVMKVEIEGSKKDTIRYKYDSLNRITSETNYSISITTVNKYDGKGNLVESTDCDLKGNDTGAKTIYSYDTAGLLIEMDYHSSGSDWKNLYKYNEKGLNTSYQRLEIPNADETGDDEDYDYEESVPTEQVTAQGTYTYDDHGNLIDDEMRGTSTEIFPHSFKNSYTYDSMGNWTKKDVVSSGVVQSPVSRKIEYYPAK